MLLMSLCWGDMSSMPQRLTVAGDAYCRLWHSKMKLTLLANWMRSPLGMVSNLDSQHDMIQADRAAGTRNTHRPSEALW